MMDWPERPKIRPGANVLRGATGPYYNRRLYRPPGWLARAWKQVTIPNFLVVDHVNGRDPSHPVHAGPDAHPVRHFGRDVAPLA